jgi:hypothetical protein
MTNFVPNRLRPGRLSRSSIVIFHVPKCPLAVKNGKEIKYGSLNYNLLDNYNGWLFRDNNVLNNIHKLEKTGISLGKAFKIKNGIATLKNNIFIFKPYAEDKEYYYLNDKKRKYLIEKAICHDIVKPNKLKSENDLKDLIEKVIYPYYSKDIILDGNSSSPKAFSEVYFKNNYPNAYRYLLDKKDQLLKRDKGGNKKYEWFEFGRSQALNDYGNKLLFPYIAKRPIFVLTTQKDLMVYCGYSILSESEYELRIIQKILLSDVFWYYIKNTSKPYANNYYALAKNYVKGFSICKLNESEKQLLLNADNNKSINDFLIEKYGLNL